MYAVMSIWEPFPGKEKDFEAVSRAMRQRMVSIQGIEFMQGLKTENGRIVVMMGYHDEPTYQAIIHDPNGPFMKALAETNLESLGRWISSERGATIE